MFQVTAIAHNMKGRLGCRGTSRTASERPRNQNHCIKGRPGHTDPSWQGALGTLEQPSRAGCSKSLRLRTEMKEHPRHMNLSCQAPRDKMFKTTAPAHKSKGGVIKRPVPAPTWAIWVTAWAIRDPSCIIWDHLEPSWYILGSAWAACWRQMFRITVPAHKNEGPPRMPQRISESLREPDVQNHCACA